MALGYSPLETGLRVLPWTATPLFVAPLAGALSDRVGRRPLLLVGMLLQASGLIVFGLLAGTNVNYLQAILALVVAGIGVSMVLPVAPAAVISAVGASDMGRASGVNTMLQRFGSAFGVAVATAIFSANGNLSSPSAFVDGLHPALAAAASLSVLGALAALGVRAAVARSSAKVALEVAHAAPASG